MKKYLLILSLASLITHFAYFGYPAETVFDEVHFGKFISGYFTHEYFFDIHPPLGKLMISGMGWLTGFRPGFSFENIGQGFPDKAYLWLRLLPTLAGALLPIVIFFLIRHLKVSGLAAFAGAMLVVFENALLVQSRFILIDSFLLLFGFLSLLFYLKHQDSYSNYQLRITKYCFLFLAGLFGALAASVKWTGITFLTLIIIIELSQIFKQVIKNRTPDNTKTNIGKLNFKILVLALVIMPIAVYFSIFALHFSLLNKSGPGDAFMTPEFRKTLVGSSDYSNPAIQPLNIFEKFKELNLQMYKSNATLTATHPYSSRWYTWPFLIRPIYYWNKAGATLNQEPQTANSRIYLLGNPVVWWAATIAIIYALFVLAQGAWLWFRKKQIFYDHALALLAGGYFLNFLPFIGIKRAMFLYHYFSALIFSIIALVYLIDKTSNKKAAFAVLITAGIAAFVFFSPLSYGLPLTENAYRLRAWLNSWI